MGNPNLTIVVLEITFDRDVTDKDKIYSRVLDTNGVWDAEDLSQ